MRRVCAFIVLVDVVPCLVLYQKPEFKSRKTSCDVYALNHIRKYFWIPAIHLLELDKIYTLLTLERCACTGKLFPSFCVLLSATWVGFPNRLEGNLLKTVQGFSQGLCLSSLGNSCFNVIYNTQSSDFDEGSVCRLTEGRRRKVCVDLFISRWLVL